MSKLRPGAHVQLPIDAAEVRFDRLRTEEEGGARLLVSCAAGDNERNLKLLWGELLGGVGVAPPSCLSCGCELRSRALAPRCRAQTLERRQRRA